jgi:hypothetical protein
MTYLLKLMDRRGGFVATPGSRRSYTHSLKQARKFSTREEAERERCQDNEAIVRLERERCQDNEAIVRLGDFL